MIQPITTSLIAITSGKSLLIIPTTLFIIINSTLNSIRLYPGFSSLPSSVPHAPQAKEEINTYDANQISIPPKPENLRLVSFRVNTGYYFICK